MVLVFRKGSNNVPYIFHLLPLKDRVVANKELLSSVTVLDYHLSVSDDEVTFPDVGVVSLGCLIVSEAQLFQYWYFYGYFIFWDLSQFTVPWLVEMDLGRYYPSTTTFRKIKYWLWSGCHCIDVWRKLRRGEVSYKSL